MGKANSNLNKKYVFKFDELNLAEQKCGQSWDRVRSLLGGKGANLARMHSLGLPVPLGFTITTEACVHNMEHNSLPEGTWEEVTAALEWVEKSTGKKFGDKENPLLFSCRSGAKFSMPGMMDTVLNIGLNDDTVEGMTKLTSARFVNDSYRRLIQGFGAVVMGIADEAFEDKLKEYKNSKNYASDTDMTAEDWANLITTFKKVFKDETGEDFIQDPMEQLRRAIMAVFSSWNSNRAFSYRNAAKISHKLGTACNIQTMVFGNRGDTSATGVCFSRSPTTGENQLYGEFLVNAQGEDVVAGVRTATKVHLMGETFPEAYQSLLDCNSKLEKYFKNMQDIEFTVEDQKLYMLQCRDGKRTAAAAVKIATDMVSEGLITKEDAIRRVSPDDVNRLLHPQLDAAAMKKAKVVTKGINASPGGGVGMIVFDANTAEKWGKEEGKDVILVRPFTKPDDVHGFFASQGVLTAEGGATSHAAVVCRQFSKPSVTGCADLVIDLNAKTVKAGDMLYKEGDWISLDGSSGIVYDGKIPTLTPSFDDQKELRTLLEYADEICAKPGVRADVGPSYFPKRGLEVWANADSGPDAARARDFGARGIGLVRTEHMFFEQSRLPTVQAMILSKTSEERVDNLNKLLPMQREDFYAIFKAMDGLPVVIRTIDPPLHEFLPHYEDLIADVAAMKATKEHDKKELARLQNLLKNVEGMHESNPMMGLRGVRLSIVMPEIVDMQLRAIFEAACDVKKELNRSPLVKIMIPLTGTVNELRFVMPKMLETMEAVFTEKGCRVDYKYGTMIETPRAALTAGPLAEEARFFSVGSNDLTQMTFGYSRDDAEKKFLLQYVDEKILPENPFQTLDHFGVGKLIKMATDDGRAVRNDLSVGLCGEHGGDAPSAKLAHEYGLDYVSCSAYRVPVMRLAVAHAVLEHQLEYHQVHHPVKPH